MAFAFSASACNGNDSNAGTTFGAGTSNSFAVGDFVVVAIALDNLGTSDAETSQVTAVVHGTNTFTKAVEYTNGSPGAGAGATVSIWYCIATAASGINSFEVTLSGSTTKKAMVGGIFTRDTSKTVQIMAGTKATGEAKSITSGTITNGVEALLIRGLAIEDNENAIDTATTNWTALTDSSAFTTGGGATANMAAGGEWRIMTGAGAGVTSNPGGTSSGDMASAVIAFEEVSTAASMPAAVGSYTITGVAAALLFGHLVTADVGSYAITGVDAGLTKGRTMTADPGSYALTGTAAPMPRTYVLTVDPPTSTGLGTEYITNGDGSSTVGWTAGNSASLSSVGGRLRVTNTAATNGLAEQNITTVARNRYKFTATRYAGTGGAWVGLLADNNGAAGVYYSQSGGDGVVTDLEIVALTTLTQVRMIEVDAVIGNYAEFDDISLRDVFGYALTGTNAAFAKGRTITVDPGSYSVTGTAVGLLFGHSMPADVGSYALTGTVAALLQGYVLTAEPAGTEYITGGGFGNAGDWSADAGWAVTGGKAVATAAVGLAKISQNNLSLPSGQLCLWSVTVSNYSAGSAHVSAGGVGGAVFSSNGLQSGSLISGGNQEMAIFSDTTLTAEFDNLSVVSVGYQIAGTDVTLTKGTSGFFMPADVGSYSLTGTAANLLFGHVMAATPGSYSLTGTDANLVQGYSFLADAGAYALTGTAASFIYYTMPAAVGSYIVTGTDVTMSRGRVIVADVGSYTIVGTSAVFSFNYFISAVPGVYTLVGKDAAFDLGVLADLVPDLPELVVFQHNEVEVVRVPKLNRVAAQALLAQRIVVAMTDLVHIAPTMGSELHVWDAPGGYAPAYGDGMNWRKTSDGTILW